ncbi:hypothetical protein ACP70R_012130 [Stipagrostis hirtigluma subsp. patula]
MPSSSSPRAAAAGPGAGADLEGRAASTSPAVNPAAGVPAASSDGDSATGSAPDSAGDGSSRGKQQRVEAEDGSRRAKKPRMAEAEAHSPPAASGRETVCGADVDKREAIYEVLDIRPLLDALEMQETAGAHSSEALTAEDFLLRPEVVAKLAAASSKMCLDELASDLARFYQGNMDDLLPATISLTCLIARAWKLDKDKAAAKMARSYRYAVRGAKETQSYECVDVMSLLFPDTWKVPDLPDLENPMAGLTAEDLVLRPEAVGKLAAASFKMCFNGLASDLARLYQGNMDNLLPATISLTYVIARAWKLNKEEAARKMADSYAVLVAKAQQETNQANEEAKKLKADLAAMAADTTKQVNEAQKRERDQAAKVEEAKERERDLAEELLRMKANVARAEEARKRAEETAKQAAEQLSKVRENLGK